MTSAVGPQPAAAMRRFVRVTVDIPAAYSVSGRDGRRRARIDDLGAGGVRLESDEDLAAGTVVTIHFPVEAQEIVASGRIALSFFDGTRARFLHGVAFTAISPDHRAVIAAYVAGHLANAGIEPTG
jgi:hypothetical protein